MICKTIDEICSLVINRCLDTRRYEFERFATKGSIFIGITKSGSIYSNADTLKRRIPNPLNYPPHFDYGGFCRFIRCLSMLSMCNKEKIIKQVAEHENKRSRSIDAAYFLQRAKEVGVIINQKQLLKLNKWKKDGI